jgi:transposase
MAATHTVQSNPSSAGTLYLAFDLGASTWHLAFTTGVGQEPRLRSVPARDHHALELEITRAKGRFKLADDAPVLSCYEAGRDGCWLHRLLTSKGVDNQVVDASSIEVNRRKRRAKTDRLDARSLVFMLVRWHSGERKLWSILQVPTADDEDLRQLHRESLTLTQERTEHVNRIKGLLATVGLTIAIDRRLPERLDGLRQWDKTPLPKDLRARILREYERWLLVDDQIQSLKKEQIVRVRDDNTPGVEKIRLVLSLKGIGLRSAWLLYYECFGWRCRCRYNRRQIGSLVGLTPTPYGSGQMNHEQGISKAGNKRLRWLMVELARCWRIHQPTSELTKWYQRRFGGGSPRVRKIGLVALARKLLIALWRYVTQGEVPQGAVEVAWQQKLSHRKQAEPAVAR